MWNCLLSIGTTTKKIHDDKDFLIFSLIKFLFFKGDTGNYTFILLWNIYYLLCARYCAVGSEYKDEKDSLTAREGTIVLCRR